MSRTTTAIDWLRPFHEAAEGRTGEALNLAMAAIDTAPAEVLDLAQREGLRVILHAFRRSQSLQVNGDAESVPMFVALRDGEVGVRHLPRFLVTVAEIDRQVDIWGNRRKQAGRELSWWTHQRDLAKQAEADPAETLGAVWDRLGVHFNFSAGVAEEAVG